MGCAHALEGYETAEVDGLLYEAFNTSGGLGTLARLRRQGRTITTTLSRPPGAGHCEKITSHAGSEVNQDGDAETDPRERNPSDAVRCGPDLRLSQWQAERPVVRGKLREEGIPPEDRRHLWSAIQVTTARLCAVADMVHAKRGAARRFVTQESFRCRDSWRTFRAILPVIRPRIDPARPGTHQVDSSGVQAPTWTGLKH